jgi:hypothetical protein
MQRGGKQGGLLQDCSATNGQPAHAWQNPIAQSALTGK